MLYLCCTQKLLKRLKSDVVEAGSSTTKLGNWYATVLPWKQQIAMFVSERTLLPVLMPLAPAANLAVRFPEVLGDILAAHGVPRPFIDSEVPEMQIVKYARTQNRSVVGIMTQFAYLAEAYRAYDKPNELIALSLKLARTPCSPLYKGPVSPEGGIERADERWGRGRLIASIFRFELTGEPAGSGALRNDGAVNGDRNRHSFCQGIYASNTPVG
ncbi:DUF6933 domain-containing protein [Trinickia acidisoli]|uniref:DUF6933 domain-containing protein n=1 Tax=Trinickia acidisoli TaxID=2767482 RepID=UPI001F5C5AD5|nr:hypothetical protein [Trinickia acidisoli]